MNQSVSSTSKPQMSLHALIHEISFDSGGYGNGHDYFSIIGVPAEQLLPFLYEHTDYDLLCDGNFERDHLHQLDVISFHAHGVRFDNNHDLLCDISSAFPDAICYWNDCWDCELALECQINGESRNDVFSLELTDFAVYDRTEPDYHACICVVTDNTTGAKFEIGGGMVCDIDIAHFVSSFTAQISNLEQFPDIRELCDKMTAMEAVVRADAQMR